MALLIYKHNIDSNYNKKKNYRSYYAYSGIEWKRWEESEVSELPYLKT